MSFGIFMHYFAVVVFTGATIAAATAVIVRFFFQVSLSLSLYLPSSLSPHTFDFICRFSK